MNKEICILLYTHSDYCDIWNLTLSLIEKYIDLNIIKVYFAVNDLNGYKLNKNIVPIFYNDRQFYTERILKITKKLNYKYILFLHEDWIITNNYDMNIIKEYINIMKKYSINHIRSYRNYGECKPLNIFDKEIDINSKIKIKNIPANASCFVSLQPGIWEKNTFIEVFNYKSNNASTLEWNVNNSIDFRKKYYTSFFYENTIKMDNSLMFPHIHSISKGRWALCNSENLEKILKKYNIDIKKRGYFNRKLNIDVYKD